MAMVFWIEWRTLSFLEYECVCHHQLGTIEWKLMLIIVKISRIWGNHKITRQYEWKKKHPTQRDLWQCIGKNVIKLQHTHMSWKNVLNWIRYKTSHLLIFFLPRLVFKNEQCIISILRVSVYFTVDTDDACFFLSFFAWIASFFVEIQRNILPISLFTFSI